MTGRASVRAVLVAWTAWAGVAAARGDELFNNGRAGPGQSGLATGTRTASNVAAPAGAQWSEAASQSGAANALAGLSAYAGSAQGGLRVADDFTVPAGVTWRLDTLRTYVYGRGVAGAPVSRLTVRIWNGPPGEPGSVVVFGDGGDRLTGATALPLYRVFATVSSPLPQAPGTTRPIWQVEASLAGAVLGPGTYWLDVQMLAGVAAGTGGAVFVPPVTTPGVRLVPGANARQLKPAAGVGNPEWSVAIDPGKPNSAPDVGLELPFALLGTAGAAASTSCDIDYNRDGFVNLDDLVDFTTDYFMPVAIPGGLQPQAPSYPDRVVGYGVPCPDAGDAPLPYAADAFRRFGYRVAYAEGVAGTCPPVGPGLDNLNDFLSRFWSNPCP